MLSNFGLPEAVCFVLFILCFVLCSSQSGDSSFPSPSGHFSSALGFSNWNVLHLHAPLQGVDKNCSQVTTWKKGLWGQIYIERVFATRYCAKRRQAVTICHILFYPRALHNAPANEGCSVQMANKDFAFLHIHVSVQSECKMSNSD